MPATEDDIRKIIDFVKKEPRTVQAVSKVLDRSWVTAETYIQQTIERTGLIDMKVFREGTRGALKIAYYLNPDAASEDEIKERILEVILQGRRKQDFDFMEVYQHVPDDKKEAFFEEYETPDVSSIQDLKGVFSAAESTVFCLSGNLTFFNVTEDGMGVREMMEEALERGVRFKILSRINVATLNNLEKLEPLMKKHPDKIDIRHSYHPLRGFIIDDKFARFKDEEHLDRYKKNELDRNLRIFYEVHDKEWTKWLTKVFWKIYRTSLDYEKRLEEINQVFR